MSDRSFSQKAAIALLLCIAVIALSSCNKDKPKENEKEKDTKTTSNNKAEMIPLPIELPEAVPGGTPVNLPNLPNMEEDTGEPRDILYVPKGTTNVALNKTVTCSDPDHIGELSTIVDGNMRGDEGEWVDLSFDPQNITIDLGDQYEIYAVMIWHYNKEKRIYFDVAVQIADDPEFKTNNTVIFNNDTDNTLGLGNGKDKLYIENGKVMADYSEGKLIDAKGIRGRFVRCHSNGNNSNEMSHYVEVAVFGKLVE